MLKSVEVTRQLSASSAKLKSLHQARMDGSDCSTLRPLVQSELDTLSCLIDESERTAHWKIHSLMFEFEALRAKLIN